MRTCPNCGAPVYDDECDYCGTKLVSENVYSPPAEENVTTQTAFTKFVSYSDFSSVPSGTPQAGMKNKTTALLLCIFLGYLGAHKFYEGKPGMGILYLLTSGIFGIGWIIDIIALALKPKYYYPN
jgi:restriction system protein